MTMPMLLDSNLSFVRRLHPSSLSVTLSNTPPHTASMTLDKNEAISPYSWVKIALPDDTMHIFRAVSISDDKYSDTQSVELEHCSAILGDYLISLAQSAAQYATIRVAGTGTEECTTAFTTLLGYQKKQNNNDPTRWTLGTVEITGTIGLEVTDMSILDAISQIVSMVPGYYLDFNDTVSPWVLNVLQKPATVTCEGRLGRNLASCNISYDTSELCTRVVDPENPGWKKDDATAQAAYGIIEKSLSFDENLTAAQKNAVATSYLNNRKEPAISITISAKDLKSATGCNLDHFTINELCRVALPNDNESHNLQIVSITYEDLLFSPDSVQISLANLLTDLAFDLAKVTKSSGGAKKKADITGKKQEEFEQTRYTVDVQKTNKYFSILATEEEITSAQTYVTKYSTLYNQTSRLIDAVASHYGTSPAGFSYIDKVEAILDAEANLIKLFAENNENIGITSNMIQKAAVNIGKIEGLAAGFGIQLNVTNESQEYTDSKRTSQTLNSTITQTAEQIELKVTKGDVATQLAVEVGNVSITGGNLVVDGYVSASEIFATSGNVTYLHYGNISGTNITASNLYIGNSQSGYDSYSPSNIHMNTISQSNPFQKAFLGRGDLDLTHAHAITVNSSTGVATMGPPCKVADAGNFNIADTQYFRNAVSAAVNSLSVSSGSQSNKARISASSSITGASAETTLTMTSGGWISAGTNTVSLKEGNNAAVATVAVQMPSMSGAWTGTTGSGAGTSNTYQVNEKDGDTVVGASTGHRVTVSVGTGTQSGSTLPIYVRTGDATTGTIVAQTTVNVSGSAQTGWDLAKSKVVRPSASTTATRLTILIPGTDYDTQTSANYDLSVDGSYAYIKNLSGTTICRTPNVYGGRRWAYVQDDTGSFYIAGAPVTAYAAGTTGTYYSLNSGENNHLKLEHYGTVYNHGVAYDCWNVSDQGTDYYNATPVSLTVQGTAGNYHQSAGLTAKYKGKYVYLEA